MIVNQRQYELSERKMKKCIAVRWKLMRRLLMASNKDEVQQEIDNLQRQAESITKQMKDYVSLTTGRSTPPNLSEVSCLPQNLVRARIALCWSQQEFARRFGVAPSQVHRWESTYYASASLSTVLAVAEFLNSNLKLQDRPLRLFDRPLKLGCDWFDDDFKVLPENR
jgi:DNA-binding transcriptional regulator YiaG